MADYGRNGPAAAVNDQRQNDEQKSGGHQIAHLFVQKAQIPVPQSDDEFPSGLERAGEDHQQDACLKQPAVESCRQDGGADAEEQDWQAVDKRHEKGETFRYRPGDHSDLLFFVHYATSHL